MLTADGSGDTLAGVEEAIANHVYQGKEKEAIDGTLSWLFRQLGTSDLDVS